MPLRPLPAITLVALLLVAGPASAHGDVRGHQGTVELAQGASFEFEAAVHYHRLVGTVDVVEGAAPVEVVVRRPDGAIQLSAGAGESLRVNRLLACCKDAMWADHVIAVRNVGDSAVTTQVDLVLLHDDFAVVAHDAEPGAAWQTFVVAVLLAGIPAALSRRSAPGDEGTARRWVRTGWWSLAAAWAGIGTLAVIGMARFGTGPLIGSRVALAPLPVYGSFVNSYLIVALPLMALWVLALIGWAVAERRSDDPRALGARRLAHAAAVGPLLFALFFALEVGHVPLALLLGVVPAALVLAAVQIPRKTIHGSS